MIAFSLRLIFLILFFVSTTFVEAANSPIESSVITNGLKLEVSLVSSNVHKLRMKITNTTDESVSFSSWRLPWQSRHSIIMVLVEAHAGNINIPELLPIADPITGTKSIAPNGFLEGSVTLEDRFPDLTQALHRTDVLVFWSYQFNPINRSPTQRLGGWLLIPKTDTEKVGPTIDN